jgi:MYXO-CTERM domain-containing protein
MPRLSSASTALLLIARVASVEAGPVDAAPAEDAAVTVDAAESIDGRTPPVGRPSTCSCGGGGRPAGLGAGLLALGVAARLRRRRA